MILEDRKRDRRQEAAREKGGWDVGQRPKAAMTYLEYPQHTRTEVTATPNPNPSPSRES